MPSANKTPNYGLNQWEGNEYPKRQDFVDDNKLIDEALTPTADPVQIPSGLTGKLSQWVSWIANRIKAITGKPNWYDTPATTLEAANSHIIADAPHSGHETPQGAQMKAEAAASASLNTAKAYTDTHAAPLSKGVTNGDNHDHNGGDGTQIDHANLTNKGTNTHAQIDTHIAAAAPHSGHISHSLATAVNDFLIASGTGAFVKKTLAEVKTILGLGSAAYTPSTDYAPSSKGVTNGDNHDHNGGDGAQIDHANLANKGTNTHAQIDSHISDNTKHPLFLLSSHSGNNYTVSIPGLTALTDGYPLCVKFDVASTGAITINPAGLGAKSVVDYFGNAVTNVRANLIANLRYDATNGNFQLLGKGGGGNFTAADLLAGKTGTGDSGPVTGSMVNNGAVTITPSRSAQVINEGYHNGNGQVAAIPSTYKKSASGSGAADTSGNFSVNNLTFSPNLIVFKLVSGSTTYRIVYHADSTFNVSSYFSGSGYVPHPVDSVEISYSSGGNGFGTEILRTASAPVSISTSSSGFTLPHSVASATVYWWAYE